MPLLGNYLTIRVQQHSSGVATAVIAETTSVDAQFTAEALDTTEQADALTANFIAGKTTINVSGDYLLASDGNQFDNLYAHMNAGDKIEVRLYRSGTLFLDTDGVLSSLSTAGANSDTLTTGAYSMELDVVSYPSILSDGNTAAWFDMASTYITMDGSNRVAAWADRSGNSNHLLQAGADGIKPVWGADGVLFDGADDFAKCVPFTLEQPTLIYIVFKQITWTSNDRFWGGDTALALLGLQRDSTPKIAIYAGAYLPSAGYDGLVLDTFGIVRALYDGANSSVQINETAASTGNAGTDDADGFTLGSEEDGSNPSNIQVKEVIIRRIEDTAPNQQLIYDYLENKYGL